MVLYYGLFALQTANLTFQRECLPKKCSSINSWIYTKDLIKHYDDCYYIFIPDEQTNCYYYNSIRMIIPIETFGEHSWIYSQSIRNHLVNSTSIYCVNNPEFIRKKISITKHENRLTRLRSLFVKSK